MKAAYISLKYFEDYKNKETVEELTHILEKQGYYTFCIVREEQENNGLNHVPKQLMKRTFEEIDMCNFVIVDLTDKGVGIGIEAGYAYAKNIPVITIAKRGSEISSTLQGVSREILFYDDIPDIEDKLAEIIKNL